MRHKAKMNETFNERYINGIVIKTEPLAIHVFEADIVASFPTFPPSTFS